MNWIDEFPVIFSVTPMRGGHAFSVYKILCKTVIKSNLFRLCYPFVDR